MEWTLPPLGYNTPMKYSLRSLMIVVLVLPPLLGMAIYYGGSGAVVAVIFTIMCLAIAVAGRAMAI